MTNALAHRGPDAEGFYHDSCISLGHRRLSIIDLSNAANQPFHDPDGRYVLLFNGEIYNYQELKNQLDHYPFQTSSDTEVLLAAFKEWGVDALKKLKGMFAFAVWDKQAETLCLMRDRMGVKPLYYYRDEQVLMFASEKRSLLASAYISKKLNRQAVVDFLSFQSTGYPDTMIQGIHALPAGSWLKIDRHHRAQDRYWKLSDIQPNHDMNPGQVQEKIFELLNESVSSRMVADVPLGAFLSGGIDSSAIVAMMSLLGKDKINTFTLSFTEKEYDESVYADTIAHRFGTQHQRHLLKPEDYVAQVSAALDAMDSPSMDGVNTYVLSSAIRKAGIKVAMTGIGGDELFVGYPGFMQYKKIMQRKAGFLLSAVGRKLMAGTMRMTQNDRFLRMADVVDLDSPHITELYPALRQVMSDRTISRLTELQPDHEDWKKILDEEFESVAGLGQFSEFSIAEYMGYTKQTLLKDADQMSMAVGLEIREPFFDHALVEFVLSLSDEMKYPHQPKQLLVDALDPLLPKAIVDRKKQGFVLPWEYWMKNELNGFCTNAIQEIAERDFINGPTLKKHWNDFLKGTGSIRWTELWLFVVLSHWMNKQGIA